LGAGTKLGDKNTAVHLSYSSVQWLMRIELASVCKCTCIAQVQQGMISFVCLMLSLAAINKKNLGYLLLK